MRALKITVSTEDDGRMIRRILSSRLNLSYHQLAKAKARGNILLNDSPVRADAKASAGGEITVILADDENKNPFTAPQNAPVSVVYEDDDIIIVDKPAPLPTQSSPRQPDDALENRLQYYFRDVDNYIFRPVNRLDKGTSGLMAIAKHAHAQARLSSFLHTPDFVREYVAVTDGIPSPDCGTIDMPIGKADGATVRREVRSDGKACVTHYETLKTANGRAELRVVLETGRTHQIRVHMSAIGCPVSGDFLYGIENADILAGRFALHSALIRLPHPITGAILTFTSPAPKEFDALLGL